MNLYEIVFKHYAPKNSESGIVGYILRESNEDVMRFLSTEYPELNGKRLWTKFYDIDGSTYEEILECKGSINYDDWYIDDLNKTMTWTWTFAQDEGNGPGVRIYNEAGLFSANGVMFSKKNFTEVVKTPDKKMIVKWSIKMV